MKKAGKITLLVALSTLAWPVMLGIWASKYAHRKIELPALRYLAIVAIMLPALTVGTVWGAAITSPVPSTPTAQKADNPPSPPPTPSQPKIEKKTFTETQEIAFTEQRTNDASITKGQEVTKQEGKPGTKAVTFEVTYANGKETARTKVKEEVASAPVPKLIAVGTKVAVATHAVTPRPAPPAPLPAAPTNSGCDPNYSPCVPIASDVDCAGGSGNGPAYVAGPVRVIGYDKYGLDSNKDGWGCE
jgi:resuscitation-promoting factor RpfB